MMKKLLLMAGAIAALAAGPAGAADLVSKAPPPPPSALVYKWTGCYVGAGLGYGMFNQDRQVVSDFPNVVLGDNLIMVNGTPPASHCPATKRSAAAAGWLQRSSAATTSSRTIGLSAPSSTATGPGSAATKASLAHTVARRSCARPGPWAAASAGSSRRRSWLMSVAVLPRPASARLISSATPQGRSFCLITSSW